MLMKSHLVKMLLVEIAQEIRREMASNATVCRRPSEQTVQPQLYESLQGRANRSDKGVAILLGTFGRPVRQTFWNSGNEVEREHSL